MHNPNARKLVSETHGESSKCDYLYSISEQFVWKVDFLKCGVPPLYFLFKRHLHESATNRTGKIIRSQTKVSPLACAVVHYF